MHTHKTTLRGKQLPLSVWIQQGWPREVVEAQPNEWSEAYQCQVYCVNVKELSWQEEFNRIEQQILQHEQEITQNRKGKKKKTEDGNDADEHASDQGEMDLPATEPEKKSKEKNPEAAAKKERAKNVGIANRAAKAVGPLQQALTTLSQLEQRLAKSNVTVEADLAATCRNVVGQLSGWTEAARSRVAASAGLMDKGGTALCSSKLCRLRLQIRKRFCSKRLKWRKACVPCCPSQRRRPKQRAVHLAEKPDRGQRQVRQKCSTHREAV